MSSEKIGRNDECWCGSGKKYKKCHLDKEQQEEIPAWEAGRKMREIFSTCKCSVPASLQHECTKKIINAHTISKSSLKSIAREGHVYTIFKSITNLSESLTMKPELQGINKATTFTGFCDLHDDRIFSPIEKQEFEATSQQCFLLSYRAFCREFYAKQSAAKSVEYAKKLDAGRNLQDQKSIQLMSLLNGIGQDKGNSDLELQKRDFDKCINENSYDEIRAVAFKLSYSPPIMVSGSTNPTYDFAGRKLQDLGDMNKTPDLLSVTSFCDESTGWIVLSWMDCSHESCNELVQSLLKKDEHLIVGLLFQYIFKNIENYCISPEWWEKQSERIKQNASALMLDSVNTTVDFNDKGMRSVFLNDDLPSIVEIIII